MRFSAETGPLQFSLPVDPLGRTVPFWQDVIAAGVAVACYSIFFSKALNMLPWPVAVGMLAHSLRWAALTVFGLGVPVVDRLYHRLAFVLHRKIDDRGRAAKCGRARPGKKIVRR